MFPVCNQVTDYKASPRVAVCFRDLKGESIVKQYDNACLFAREAAEKGKMAVIRNALDDLSARFSESNDNVSICDQLTLSSFIPVTSSYISQLIGKSTVKSCPLDPAPAFALKQLCIPVLLPVMTRIINQSICSSAVPKIVQTCIA